MARVNIKNMWYCGDLIIKDNSVSVHRIHIIGGCEVEVKDAWRGFNVHRSTAGEII